MPEDNPSPKQSLLGKMFAACQGRHTAFTMAFFFVGNLMHWFHRLDGTYITFMATLMGFVLGHSAKESYFKDGQGQ